MANNGGRQAGGGGNGQMNEHVEFTVKVRFGLVGVGGKRHRREMELRHVQFSTDST